MRVSSIAVYLSIVLLGLACDTPKQTDQADPSIEMLKNFYTLYITASASTTGNEEELESIKNKYCTEDLLKDLKETDLDYDPFLNAQDSEIEWLKTLTINKTNEKDGYQVCFMDSYENKLNCISLSVSEQNNTFKINRLQ